MLRIEWAGEALELLAERAVHWSRRRTLLLADPHFGKAASFCQAGLPVPTGGTAVDLERLSTALRRTAAERLVVLGDLLHAPAAQAQATQQALFAWRKHHRQLEVVLVVGNHDRRAGLPAECLGISTATEPLVDSPLALCHEPGEHGQMHVLAGHVHPGVVLHEAAGGSLRAACFWFGPRLGLLPAFGSFTGCRRVRPRRGDRVFIVGPGAVVEVR